MNLVPKIPFAAVCAVGMAFAGLAHGQLVRQANTTLNLPAELPVTTSYNTANAITGQTFIDPICTAFPPGETNRLYVLERGTDGVRNNVAYDNIGRVVLVTALSTTPAQTVFMDLETYLESPEVNTPLPSHTTNECGMLSFVFHPNYNQNGYFFVYFSITINGQLYQRLARFQATGTPGNYLAATSASPATMTPLLTIYDEANNHNGGDLAFGPEGYLYLSLGDEGGSNDQHNNARFINKDFWGQMIRIDVDNRPENLTPNPHSQPGAIPSAVHAGTYKVPADNPFIGFTSWHNLPISASTVRTEIFATGLRNPFRFSIDPGTGRIFLGDVGQYEWEEVDLIVKGGDYGWSWLEGTHDLVGEPSPTTPPGSGFNPIPPIYEYVSDNSAGGIISGQSVCGGMVYRGNQFTELQGKYLFNDMFGGGGAIAALTETSPGVWTAQRIATRAQIVDWGTDPRNGEPLLCSMLGTILRLERSGTPTGTPPPALLSGTGAFSNLSTLAPNTGIVAYEPNVNFWSDHALKSRWFAIKNTTDTMTFSSAGNWTFPTGTVWIKHFDIETTRGVPATRRKLETRFLVKTATDIYGLSYKWRTDQTDAELVAETGLTEAIPSSSPAQTWRYPSRGECVTCHTQVGGHALSFNTRQLNRMHDHGAGPQNQIQALSNAGYFSTPVSGVNNLPAFAPAGDTTQSLEWRVRSYLAVNCLQCHQPGGAVQGAWDARSTTPTDMANLINGLLVNDGGDAANRFVVPGDALHSMLLKRQQGNGVPRMPPLGTLERDLANEQLVSDWIASLASRQNFAQWQAAQSPPVGGAGDDPDRDGRNNFMEYMTGTNPNASSSGWSYGVMQSGGGVAQFGFTHPANRAAIIETSANLINWETWNAPGNAPLYPAADTQRTITAPLDSPAGFFRVRFEEL
ncbi:MAG: PQQ-dependent sugar dehydrogenase [Prosthecobacter sp.]